MTKNKTTDFARQARLEMELMATESMGVPSVVNFLLSLVYAAFIFSSVVRLQLLSWVLFMFVVMGLRLLSQGLLRRPDLGSQERNRYFSLFNFAVLLNGAGWGSTVLFLFSGSDPLQQMVLIGILLGVAAGALGGMAPVVKLYKVFILLLIVPLIIRLCCMSDSRYVMLIVLPGFFLATLFVLAGKIHASLFSSISLRLENEALLHDIFATKGQVEQANIALQVEVDEHQKARRELEDARDRTERAIQVKTRFISNITHELNTPMTGIVGFTHQLRQTALAGAQESLLRNLDESSVKLHYLIKNLLDYSELESGVLELKEELFKPELMLEELIFLFKSQAQDKGLTLQLNVTKDEQNTAAKLPEWLVGDQVRLKQILGNLLDNAIKFTDCGAVNLSVERKERELDSGEKGVGLRFCVSDTGPGIAEEVQETIFSSFQQGDGSLTRAYGGTGVGLSIAQKLVTLMAGKISYESVVEEGSWFYVEVPLKLGKKPVEVSREITVSDDAAVLSRILLVDDNPLNLELLNSILKEKNFKPYLAESGLRALEILAREKIDMIFTDLQMPVLDGLQMTRVVRGLEAGDNSCPEILSGIIPQDLLAKLQTRLVDAHIVIVAITAHLTTGTKKECLGVGIDDCLGKPFRAEEIFGVINNCFPACVGLHKLPSGNRDAEFSEAENIVACRVRAEQYLRENYFLDDSAIATMLETLERSLVANFNEAEQALCDNDLIRLSQIAHSLKGSIANIGFSELAEKARDIEIGAREQPDLPYAEMVDQLKSSLAELM